MAVNGPRRAVFLDKDGTLVRNRPYNVDTAAIELNDGAEDGLRMLRDAGFRLFVVSNQSGVARGYFPEDALAAVESELRKRLARIGVPLAGFYYCPHLPHAEVPACARTCDCRKPQPGMLLRAGREHDLDLGQSWLVGDILDDVEAGNRAGCRTVLLDNGGETEWDVTLTQRIPSAICSDLGDAAWQLIEMSRVGWA